MLNIKKRYEAGIHNEIKPTPEFFYFLIKGPSPAGEQLWLGRI